MAITLDGTSGINTSGTLVATGSLTTSSSLTTGTGAVYNGLQASTAQATTSGTSITFSSIPSWVKRISVMFNGVSTSGTSSILVQIGAASVETTGYNSSSGFLNSGVSQNGTSSTAGFIISTLGASDTKSGIMTIANISGSTWIASGTFKATAAYTTWMAGDKAITGTLATLAITTVNGTDTFDAGSINILYE